MFNISIKTIRLNFIKFVIALYIIAYLSPDIVKEEHLDGFLQAQFSGHPQSHLAHSRFSVHAMSHNVQNKQPSILTEEDSNLPGWKNLDFPDEVFTDRIHPVSTSITTTPLQFLRPVSHWDQDSAPPAPTPTPGLEEEIASPIASPDIHATPSVEPLAELLLAKQYMMRLKEADVQAPNLGFLDDASTIHQHIAAKTQEPDRPTSEAHEDSLKRLISNLPGTYVPMDFLKLFNSSSVMSECPGFIKIRQLHRTGERNITVPYSSLEMEKGMCSGPADSQGFALHRLSDEKISELLKQSKKTTLNSTHKYSSVFPWGGQFDGDKVSCGSKKSSIGTGTMLIVDAQVFMEVLHAGAKEQVDGVKQKFKAVLGNVVGSRKPHARIADEKHVNHVFSDGKPSSIVFSLGTWLNDLFSRVTWDRLWGSITRKQPHLYMKRQKRTKDIFEEKSIDVAPVTEEEAKSKPQWESLKGKFFISFYSLRGYCLFVEQNDARIVRQMLTNDIAKEKGIEQLKFLVDVQLKSICNCSHGFPKSIRVLPTTAQPQTSWSAQNHLTPQPKYNPLATPPRPTRTSPFMVMMDDKKCMVKYVGTLGDVISGIFHAYVAPVTKQFMLTAMINKLFQEITGKAGDENDMGTSLAGQMQVVLGMIFAQANTSAVLLMEKGSMCGSTPVKRDTTLLVEHRHILSQLKHTNITDIIPDKIIQGIEKVDGDKASYSVHVFEDNGHGYDVCPYSSSSGAIWLLEQSCSIFRPLGLITKMVGENIPRLPMPKPTVEPYSKGIEAVKPSPEITAMPAEKSVDPSPEMTAKPEPLEKPAGSYPEETPELPEKSTRPSSDKTEEPKHTESSIYPSPDGTENPRHAENSAYPSLDGTQHPKHAGSSIYPSPDETEKPRDAEHSIYPSSDGTEKPKHTESSIYPSPDGTENPKQAETSMHPSPDGTEKPKHAESSMHPSPDGTEKPKHAESSLYPSPDGTEMPKNTETATHTSPVEIELPIYVSVTPFPDEEEGTLPSMDGIISASPEMEEPTMLPSDPPSTSPSQSQSGTSISAMPSPSNLPDRNNAGVCFPARAKVETQDRRMVAMEKLTVGELVRDGSGRFSTVLLMSHSRPDVKSEMVHIKTDTGEIMLSPRHYLPVNGSLKTAESVVVGDEVSLVHCQEFGLTTQAVVKRIERSVERGVYAPMTASGSVAVQWYGVAVGASCYTAHIHPTVAHWLLSPLRVLHRYCGMTVPMLSKALRDGSNLLVRLMPDGPSYIEL